jgi:hypothetical protein
MRAFQSESSKSLHHSGCLGMKWSMELKRRENVDWHELGGHLAHSGRFLRFDRRVFNEEISWEIRVYIVCQGRVRVTHLAWDRIRWLTAVNTVRVSLYPHKTYLCSSPSSSSYWDLICIRF